MVQFNNLTTGTGPITYEWYFGDGSPAATAANPSHTYTSPGIHQVTLTAVSYTQLDVYKRQV